MTFLHGWESGVWVERREMVIMREMSRSNVESRRILRNGKPQDYRNESLLIPLSILRQTVSHGRKWREGEGRRLDQQNIFWSLWPCETISLLYSLKEACWGIFLLAITGLTSRDRIQRCAKRVMKEGCRAITTTFEKNKLRSSFLEGTGTSSASSNQSNEWVESHGAGKNTLGKFRLLHIYFIKAKQTLWTKSKSKSCHIPTQMFLRI